MFNIDKISHSRNIADVNVMADVGAGVRADDKADVRADVRADVTIAIDTWLRVNEK